MLSISTAIVSLYMIVTCHTAIVTPRACANQSVLVAIVSSPDCTKRHKLVCISGHSFIPKLHKATQIGLY